MNTSPPRRRRRLPLVGLLAFGLAGASTTATSSNVSAADEFCFWVNGTRHCIPIPVEINWMDWVCPGCPPEFSLKDDYLTNPELDQAISGEIARGLGDLLVAEVGLDRAAEAAGIAHLERAAVLSDGEISADPGDSLWVDVVQQDVADGLNLLHQADAARDGPSPTDSTTMRSTSSARPPPPSPNRWRSADPGAHVPEPATSTAQGASNMTITICRNLRRLIAATPLTLAAIGASVVTVPMSASASIGIEICIRFNDQRDCVWVPYAINWNHCPGCPPGISFENEHVTNPELEQIVAAELADGVSDLLVAEVAADRRIAETGFAHLERAAALTDSGITTEPGPSPWAEPGPIPWQEPQPWVHAVEEDIADGLAGLQQASATRDHSRAAFLHDQAAADIDQAITTLADHVSTA